MQQFVRYILPFYMLTLALIPCMDTVDAGVLSTTTEIEVTAQAHPDDHDHQSKDCEEDACPPFCICDCCSCVISIPQMTTIALPVFTPKPSEAPVSTANFPTTGVKNAIWSPPRL
jgi:hypothetical protein